MKKNFLPSTIYFLIIISAVILVVRHFHIKDFCIIKPNVLYTAGQPRGMDYTRLLYKYHISTIINVRFVSEHREKNWYNEELTWIKQNAVKYIELSIDKDDFYPSQKTQEKFISIMGNQKNLPVLLHGSGDDKRVAMLTAVWLIKTQNKSLKYTKEQVKKIIDDRPLRKEEIDFITNLKQAHVP